MRTECLLLTKKAFSLPLEKDPLIKKDKLGRWLVSRSFLKRRILLSKGRTAKLGKDPSTGENAIPSPKNCRNRKGRKKIEGFAIEESLISTRHVRAGR